MMTEEASMMLVSAGIALLFVLAACALAVWALRQAAGDSSLVERLVTPPAVGKARQGAAEADLHQKKVTETRRGEKS